MKEINKLITKLKYYFVGYQPFIFYSLIFFGLLLSFSSLPYINLVLAKGNLIVFMSVVFWIVNVILFQPSLKVSFVIAIIFCFSAYLLSLTGAWFEAEIAGDIIYIIFVTGVLQMIFSQLKKCS